METMTIQLGLNPQRLPITSLMSYLSYIGVLQEAMDDAKDSNMAWWEVL